VPLLASESTVPLSWALGVGISLVLGVLGLALKAAADTREAAHDAGRVEGALSTTLARIDTGVSDLQVTVATMRDSMTGLSADVRRLDHDMGRHAEEAAAARQWRAGQRAAMHDVRTLLQTHQHAIRAIAEGDTSFALRVIDLPQPPPPQVETPRRGYDPRTGAPRPDDATP
jgi:hypothetical protein